MKSHLNTLFVTTEGTYLGREGRAVVVKRGPDKPLRVPIHMIESIVCLVPTRVSPFAMALCAEHNVSVSYHDAAGRFLARVEGRTSGNVLLRRAQFQASEDEAIAVDYARIFILAKIQNCRSVISRAARDHGDPSGELAAASEELAGAQKRASARNDIDPLRGIEGEAARTYFSVFSRMVLRGGADFQMTGRSRRPPRDRINAMLSFGYALLASDMRSACESVGLDPQIGFLHALRPGRPSLALDLAEEFRPVIADRLVLTLINRDQIGPEDFDIDIGGAVRLTDDGRKTFIVQYQKRKKDEITHPFLQERVTLGLLPLLQARLLARSLRGDVDAYPAFIWR